jgi:PAS domain S-box-containing protein
VLIVEDSDDDAQLLIAHLRKAGYRVTAERVETARAMTTALATREWDLVLSDYRMPQFSAQAALDVLQASGRDLPCIIVSGTIGEDTAVACLKAGAHDFVLKDRLARLVPAIERELREVEVRRERSAAETGLRESEKRYREMVEGLPVGVYRTGPDGTLLDANSVSLEMFGLPAGEVPRHFNVLRLYADPGDRDRWRAVADRGELIGGAELRVRRPDGSVIWVRDTSHAVRGADGTVCYYEGVLEDITALRVAEDESRRGAARFRALTEYASDVLTIIAPNGTIEYESPAAQHVLGYQPAELVGRNAFEYIHPDDVGRVREVLTRSLADPQGIGRATYRFRHKDGTWRYLDSVGRNLLSEAAVRGIVINSRDVTERVEMEQELRKGVTELQATEAELRTRTFELGERVKELRCLYAISTMLAESGPELHWPEVVNRMPAGWRFPELAAVRLTLEERVYATEGFSRTAWRQETSITVDGTVIGTLEVCYREQPPASADGLVFLDEERLLLESVAEQIASAVQRWRAEQALASREARFRGLIENTSDLIAIFGADRRVLYASPSYERVLGYPLPEMLGSDLFEFVHPDDRERILSAFTELVEGENGARRVVAFRYRHQDGTWKHLESVAVNLLDDPNLSGVVATTRDLTEQVELEEQYRQAQKMEAVGRLAGGVAHDFNNLLTVIDANATFLLEALGPNDPRRDDAEEIKRAAQRAASLTRQLLAFSRRQVLQPLVLDVNAVVADMDKMLRRLIGEDVELVTVLTPDLQPVLADPGQVEQVILNLTVNARDAMPDGGKLTIETRNVDLDAPYAAAHQEVQAGPHVMVAVSDTGVGMTAETQRRIFEPFFTTKGHGTGLGLATVYGIVNQSKGHITVCSEAGRGATFNVYLPATDEEAGQRRTGEMPVPVARAAETVLLVEDESAVRTISTRVLREAGYTVLAASSGPEALELVMRHPGSIDALVTDVIMPQMSGRELAEQLVRLRPGLKVLYVSGYTDDSILHHGVLEPGMFFLEKPFTPEAILRKLRQVLTAPAQAGPARAAS